MITSMEEHFWRIGTGAEPYPEESVLTILGLIVCECEVIESDREGRAEDRIRSIC